MLKTVHHCNRLAISGILVLFAVTGLLFGQQKKAEDSEDKTLSPYFFVNSDDPTDRMPLKSTAASVVISGVIADVEVTQVYKNEGKNTLEAIYIFPGSTRAAVYAMRMTIGKRTIEAKIQEREQARQTYENALKEGKTASLLEQQRPNVFQMNVGNILPGDEITVRLNYTELLVPEKSVYEFVYPTVVGPRYSNQTESQAGKQDKWVANPYLEEGKDAPFTFEFSCRINGGIPISRLTCPSHEAHMEFTGKTSAEIHLEKSASAGNRDVVLQYSLAGDAIESGLLLNIGKKEDFFLLMVEPPKRVETKMVVPREYIFVIDVSGSMHGFPLQVTKALMKDLLGNLRPSDFFNVMLFAGGNSVLSQKSLPATAENLQKALDVIDSQQGGGGTELMPALKAAMALPRTESNVSRSTIIVTDGFVSVEKDAFEYIANNLDKGNVFSFGIGSSVNRFLIEGMAHAGMGEPFIVLDPDQAASQAKKLREYIDSPVLTDIKVDFGGLQTSDVVPVTIPDLFARKPVVIFGKYTGTPKGTITVSGKTAGAPYKHEIRVSEGKISTENKALRYLWARHKIMQLADYVKLTHDDKRVKEITDLGLTYNLLTDYTSFVAVDNQVRTGGKPQTTVKQPLPLPQGVSNMAVGTSVTTSSAPMPGLQMERAMKRSPRMVQKVMSEQRDDKLDENIEKLKKELVEEQSKPQRPSTEIKLTVSFTLGAVPAGIDSMKIVRDVKAQLKKIREVISKSGRTGAGTFLLKFNASGSLLSISSVNNTFGSTTLEADLSKILHQIFVKEKSAGEGTVSLTITAVQSR